MVARNLVFWEVDVQADFMLPGGKLYVPGAEKLLPNIRRLTDAARQDRVFLLSVSRANDGRVSDRVVAMPEGVVAFAVNARVFVVGHLIAVQAMRS